MLFGALFGSGVSEVFRKVVVALFPSLQAVMSFGDLMPDRGLGCRNTWCFVSCL